MKKSSKRKTKQEATASEILNELMALVKLFEIFPKGRGSDKRWAEGMVYGVKYAIVHITEKFIDDDKKDVYKKLIDWEKEQKKLLNLGKAEEKLLKRKAKKKK